MNKKLRERMENEKQKLLNESDYQEGESCSSYMNEIGAFKTGFNKGAEWMHSELWPFIEESKKFLTHKIHCNINHLSLTQCTCGLDHFRNLLEQFEKGE